MMPAWTISIPKSNMRVMCNPHRCHMRHHAGTDICSPLAPTLMRLLTLTLTLTPTPTPTPTLILTLSLTLTLSQTLTLVRTDQNAVVDHDDARTTLRGGRRRGPRRHEAHADFVLQIAYWQVCPLGAEKPLYVRVWRLMDCMRACGDE